MEALFGLIGVIVGWAGGSSYAFWATRRAELAAALIATAVLEEELGRVAVGSRAPGLSAAWNDHRAALVQHLRPDDFQRLGTAIERVVAAGAASPAPLRAVVADLARIFWNAHQAFILTPLIDYLVKRETLSMRLNGAMAGSQLQQEPDASSDVPLGSALG